MSHMPPEFSLSDATEHDQPAIEALLDAQKWSEASPLLDAMVKQHPGDAIAWYNLGICRQAAGDFPAALACFGMAKTLRPKDLEIQKAFDGVMGPR